MRLRYTLKAAVELEDILTYVEARSPQGGRTIKQRIHTITQRLLKHPGMGRRTRNPLLRRVATVPYPYLIFYQATNEEIIIHGVRHGARNPTSMPEQ